MPPTRKLKVQALGDVPTSWLEPRDLVILSDPQSPGHLANADDLTGALFRIPRDYNELQATVQALLLQGFSIRFVEVITELHSREVPFAWFHEPG